jgi:chemotaxis protein CheX
MSHLNATLNPYCAEDFLSVESLERADEAVSEIFRMMFCFEINPVDVQNPNLISPELDERTAVVGFSGPMRGSCHIRIGLPAATAIASAMLGGVPIEEDDGSINDALGELCNMLAGGWKNAIPALSSACTLSSPTVISGHDYKIHIRQPSVSLSRTYKFDIHALHLTLYCEDSQIRMG